jgi:uncharacterized protein (TIGR02588 family)
MKQEKNWLEWLVFAVSAVLVACVIGQLSFDAINVDGEPPSLEIELGEPRQQAGAYAVEVIILNGGDTTAEAVKVEVFSGDERSELEMDFVPRHSFKRGWVTFTKPPTDMHTRVLGYKTP